MGVNQVQEAIRKYSEIVAEANRVYEQALKNAEADLRSAMSIGIPEPPSDQVVMKKEEFEKIYKQLEDYRNLINPG